ncbi:Permease of the drug/metabolite transporter (DMT) superfamily [hydrothermal vent metagenome]|uniref:Permease of the drug/metabolite transporter (DMT) superfamily n=1 Tax=hydrothermal vent metagenome TaxID=652676 RepID=A0A3B0WX02_9ZZZZ
MVWLYQYGVFVFNQRMSEVFKGMLLGFLAIICFSGTFPATRLAVMHLDPMLVGLGRSLFVAGPALLFLRIAKFPLPSNRQWKSLVIVMLGIVIGFPWLTSLAMQNMQAGQGGIVASMIPLFTAIAAALRLRQRPSMGFWLMALLGSGLVLIYLLWGQQGGLQESELILLGASVVCAVGYAEGGKLAREMGGIAVISWALVLSVPLSLLLIMIYLKDAQLSELWQSVNHAPLSSWIGFFYTSVISQWVGFMFWYKGLALGGVIRVSQTQLLQPFLTLWVSMLLLNEQVTLHMLFFAVAVVLTVAIGRKMPIYETRV